MSVTVKLPRSTFDAAYQVARAEDVTLPELLQRGLTRLLKGTPDPETH